MESQENLYQIMAVCHAFTRYCSNTLNRDSLIGSRRSLLFLLSRIIMERETMSTSLFFRFAASPILMPVEYSNLNNTGIENILTLKSLRVSSNSSAALNMSSSSSLEKMYGA